MRTPEYLYQKLEQEKYKLRRMSRALDEEAYREVKTSISNLIEEINDKERSYYA